MDDFLTYDSAVGVYQQKVTLGRPPEEHFQGSSRKRPQGIPIPTWLEGSQRERKGGPWRPQTNLKAAPRCAKRSPMPSQRFLQQPMTPQRRFKGNLIHKTYRSIAPAAAMLCKQTYIESNAYTSASIYKYYIYVLYIYIPISVYIYIYIYVCI